MPLYIRGTISFGTIVATLAATAGDSAFVIIGLAPKAAVYSYAVAFVATIYTTIPAFVVGILLYFFWPFAQFEFGVL